MGPTASVLPGGKGASVKPAPFSRVSREKRRTTVAARPRKTMQWSGCTPRATMRSVQWGAEPMEHFVARMRTICPSRYVPRIFSTKSARAASIWCSDAVRSLGMDLAKGKWSGVPERHSVCSPQGSLGCKRERHSLAALYLRGGGLVLGKNGWISLPVLSIIRKRQQTGGKGPRGSPKCLLSDGKIDLRGSEFPRGRSGDWLCGRCGRSRGFGWAMSVGKVRIF